MLSVLRVRFDRDQAICVHGSGEEEWGCGGGSASGCDGGGVSLWFLNGGLSIGVCEENCGCPRDRHLLQVLLPVRSFSTFDFLLVDHSLPFSFILSPLFHVICLDECLFGILWSKSFVSPERCCL